MKVAMLMLGDLHFFGKEEIEPLSNEHKNNFISNRIDMLIKLLKVQCNGFNDVIIIINGDISNSGQKSEYSSAFYYINKIREVFKKKSITPYFIFSQGNHDLKLQNGKFKDDKSVNYYYFINRFVDYCSIERSLYCDIYRINTLGVKMNFIAMNPFVNCKSLRDYESKRFMIDSSSIKDNIRLSKKEINIFLSHIPVDWYDRNNPNNYKFLEEQSFKIFSHEHNDTVFKREDGKTSLYLNCFSEESRKNVCGIVFGCFDTVTTSLNLCSYKYTADAFVSQEDYTFYLTDFFGYDYSEYKLYKNSFDKFMNEDISALCGEDVSFLELFSEPSFYVTGEEEYENGETKCISLSELMNCSNYFKLIIGKKRTGKTSVLKYIFSEELKNGNCPIYVKINNNNVVEGIKDKVKKFILDTYVNGYDEIMTKNNIILLIDDFDLIRNPLEIDKIRNLFPCVSKVYVCSNDEYTSLNLSKYSSDISFFKMQPFGYESRYKLINKWVENRYPLSLENDKNLKNDEIFRVINNISTDILLSPDLVLIFLNAYKNNEAEQLVNSTKIIYYKYLVSKYLIELCEKVSFRNKNIVEFFYKELAYFYFNNTEKNFQEFNQYFLETYSIDHEEYYSNLKYLKCNLFFNVDSEEKFKLSFFNAYFIAEYYKSNISKVSVKEEFINLIDNVSQNDLFVNIILFFFYNYSHEEYLERCILNMQEIFKEEKLFDFDDDIKIFNSFIKDIKNEVKKEGKVVDNKISILKRLDEEIQKSDTKKEKTDFTLTLIASNNYLEICTEILPIIGKKEYSNQVLKSMIELCLRRLSNFLNISKVIISKCNTLEEFNNNFYLSLALISAMIDDIGTKISSSYYQDIMNILSSYNLVSTECIKKKIDFILLRKNDSKSDGYIDSIVNYKEKLISNKNYIAAAFLLINIDIELNYIGAYNRKNVNLIIEKSNKRALSYGTKNPLIEMTNSTNRKNIRRKKFHNVTKY